MESSNGGLQRSAEEQAVRALKADGIEHAYLWHSGGGIMLARIDLAEGDDPPHVLISSQDEPDHQWGIGAYRSYDASCEGGDLTYADCLPAMVEAVRESMKELA